VSFAGLNVAGLKVAGLKVAGLNVAGLKAAGLKVAGLWAAGFMVPATAEPFSGVVATRAFLVVLRELIRDFFWMVKFCSSWFFLIAH
jgi:hypothetical protein